MSSGAEFGRDLPYNEYQAAVGANNPSASNVFATMADIVSAGGIQHAVASGTNTYTATIPGVLSYTDGDVYAIRFTNGNDADSTININGLGAITLTKQSNIQVTGGDIISNQEIIIVYDGTNFQCINVAPNQLFAYVTNDDAVTINKGQPVYAFGSTGNRMSVKLAYNTSDATSAQTVGVVFSTSIAPNQRGFVITQGVIDGLDTSMYAPGDQLYLGSTAGALTNLKPYAPNHLVYIGIVERANAGNGQIYIKPQNGYELDELHDVDLITVAPIDGDVLTYNSITGLWEPKASTSSNGRFGIADSNGQYTYYTTLTLALAAAVPGQTVEFFTDYVETGAVSINLVDGVNINMNGHSYTCTYNAAPHDMFYAAPANLKFQNGTIIIDSGASTNLMRGIVASLGSDIDATGLTIKVISSGGKGRPLVTGTFSCTVRNITCIAIDDIAIFADAATNLYNCYGESTAGTGISLGNTGISASTAIGYNCVGVSSTGTGIIVGVTSQAIECYGRSSSSYGMYVFGGFVIGGYAISSSGVGMYASTIDQIQDKPFRVRGAEISGGTANPAVQLVYDGTSTTFGTMESCSILAGTNGDGIQLNTNGVFQNKLIVTNNTIRVVTAARNCLVGTAASTYCNYVQNIFAGATTPVNANVLQGVVNTPDLQGNILI